MNEIVRQKNRPHVSPIGSKIGKEEEMEFIKTIIKNRKLIWQLGRNDFRNRFASTSLGSIWGFLQPFVFMFTYVIVFQYILKTGSSRRISLFGLVFTRNGYMAMVK